MFTLVVVSLLVISFLCSLILVAAMVVASRANAKAVDSLERLQRISNTPVQVMTDEQTANAQSISSSSSTQLAAAKLATHRNIAEELRTHSGADHERQATPALESPPTPSANSEQPEHASNQPMSLH